MNRIAKNVVFNYYPTNYLSFKCYPDGFRLSWNYLLFNHPYPKIIHTFRSITISAGFSYNSKVPYYPFWYGCLNFSTRNKEYMKQFLKFLLILLLAFGMVRNGYAQKQGQTLIDSLLQELPKAKEDTNKVNLLNDLSSDYKRINPDEGIKYGQMGLELAAKLDWKKGIANANNRIGLNYISKSDNPKAFEYCQRAIKLYEELGDKRGVAVNTGNIGNVYASLSDYPKALEYYFKALKQLEELGDKKSVAIYTSNIGSIYKFQSDYPKALEYYFKALKMDEEIGNKSGINGLSLNIGATYIEQKNYTMGIEYNQKALKMAEEMGDKHTVAGSLCNIGEAYISIIEDTSAKSNKVTGNAELAVNKYQPNGAIPKGKAALLSSAIDYIQRSLLVCKEINDLDFMEECYANLAEAYKLKGDYKKAMEYADNGRAIKDSVFSKQNSDKIAKLENDRKQYGDSLKAVAAKRVADIKAQHQRNYEYIGAGVIVLLIGFTFLLTRNNKLLGKEKKQSDTLLLNILPEEVASQLKKTGTAAARQFDDVTVLFTDFVNFTSAGERMSPQALIDELNTCFKAFDEITGRHNVEKIKTIGDAYLAVAGLPTTDPRHAENVVRAAIDINAFMQDRLSKLGERTFDIRIGIHSGSVVAGIVGLKKFAYDIWGDTVNTAARMEQNSEAGKINISQTTYELVKDKFTCEYRGEIDAKGKGQLKMYYII